MDTTSSSQDRAVTVVTAVVNRAFEHARTGSPLVRLPEETIPLLMQLLEVASLKVPGLKRCSVSAESNPNRLPFMISEQRSHANTNSMLQHALGWLNEILRLAMEGPFTADAQQQAIYRILAEVARSHPLEPIKLCDLGNLLVDMCPTTGLSKTHLVDRRRDHTPLPAANSSFSQVGIHQYCNGYFSRRRQTKEHDVLICDECHFRRYFPAAATTYGDLRKAMGEGL